MMLFTRSPAPHPLPIPSGHSTPGSRISRSPPSLCCARGLCSNAGCALRQPAADLDARELPSVLYAAPGTHERGSLRSPPDSQGTRQVSLATRGKGGRFDSIEARGYVSRRDPGAVMPWGLEPIWECRLLIALRPQVLEPEGARLGFPRGEPQASERWPRRSSSPWTGTRLPSRTWQGRC